VSASVPPQTPSSDRRFDAIPAAWLGLNARLEAVSPLFALLSPAEREVTFQIGLGLSNKEIAEVLGKSPATVKAQVAAILRKLQVSTRCRLIVWLHQYVERGPLS
jgi:DNA-binding CsgD family transcriptional regulator